MNNLLTNNYMSEMEVRLRINNNKLIKILNETY